MEGSSRRYVPVDFHARGWDTSLSEEEAGGAGSGGLDHRSSLPLLLPPLLPLSSPHTSTPCSGARPLPPSLPPTPLELCSVSGYPSSPETPAGSPSRPRNPLLLSPQKQGEPPPLSSETGSTSSSLLRAQKPGAPPPLLLKTTSGSSLLLGVQEQAPAPPPRSSSLLTPGAKRSLTLF